ncbi:LysM peptidoglycan-binding domain-containing protein [Priestia filamentosa]|uniref:LysM peptidoglycan-binding domain-containing protein n=1 Tax=Priestia filamentosa TaxID=1402861 RepID=UPI00397ABBB7
MSRIPDYCPPGFTQYTVVRGDTIFLIARRLRIDTGLIIANNPHISNPLLIFPGDILCVPITIALPCCTVLRALTPTGNATEIGVVLAQQLPNGEQAVSFLATGLPNPSKFGNFDAYEGFISFPGIGSFSFVLVSTPEMLPTWSRTITLAGSILFSGANIQIRTTNTTTYLLPTVVLQGNLCTNVK